MRDEARQSSQAKWLRMGVAAGSISVLATLAAYNSRQKTPAHATAHGPPAQPLEIPADLRAALANARAELAENMVRNQPEAALPILVAALEADPSCEQARTLACDVLTKIRWQLPVLTLDHKLPVDHVQFAAPHTLWVSISGKWQTAVKWNLETLQIESVLFPVKAPETSCMVFDAAHKSVVIGRAGTTLLCDAQSLKPIRDLGPIPDDLTPEAVLAFSADGLLLAHPAFVSTTDHAIVWHIRETHTGEIIRSSDPVAPDKPAPLAAVLDRLRLRVLHQDGSLLDMPVSPVEPVTTTPREGKLLLRHAQFSEDGRSALVLTDMGPLQAPRLSMLAMDGKEAVAPDPMFLLDRFPWSGHPGIWSGLMREIPNPPLVVDGGSCRFTALPFAPFVTTPPITSVALAGDRVIIGSNSTLAIHQVLPFPLVRDKTRAPGPIDNAGLKAFSNLTKALAGRYNRTSDPSVRVDIVVRPDVSARLQAFKDCDFAALSRVFPELDFSPIIARISNLKPRSVPQESLLPLWDRLARADATGNSWDDLIDASTGGGDAVETAIQLAGNRGPAAAKAFELALASTHPEWIDACLTKSVDLPPLLRQLALSRIAWLQDRRADALAAWPEVFPDYQQVRLREDWDGWEQADFSKAYEKLRLCMAQELDALVLPANSTPEQRKAVAEHFADPATIKAVGHARFAKACIKAALAFSAFKDEKETTFKLAATARDLGEAPQPCLRAEAMALTAMGDYQHAHERWVTLITEHPVNTQEPGDYAEASYTAFENSNPQQAMAILTTGLHRFPNDANFALRAGWVALLTGNGERAYRFLLAGRQIGYPKEKLENATALLAIAASQSGAAEDAAAFYQDLIDLDPAWRKPETLETLDWPEELKASLRQLVW